MLIKYALNSQPYIGIFTVGTDKFTIIPPLTDTEIFQEAMETEVITSTIGGTHLLGAFVCANSKGVMVTDIIGDAEADSLLEHVDLAVAIERHNALGNNVLVNDKGALINPDISKSTEEGIREVLDVDVIRGTIAGIGMVGSQAVVTNKGCLCHPHTSDEEISVMEDLFGVQVKKSTANHGSGWIGTCMIANSKGAVIGDRTTPIEMGRIEEGLGYLD